MRKARLKEGTPCVTLNPDTTGRNQSWAGPERKVCHSDVPPGKI